MIRLLLSLLFLHATVFTLVSCTTAPDSDEFAEDSGPIEDEEQGDFAEEATGGGDEIAGDEIADDEFAGLEEELGDEISGDEFGEDLEAELDAEGVEDGDMIAEEEPGLSDEIAEGDLEELEPAPAPPVASDDLEDTFDEPAAPETPPAPELARVRDIRYLANASGGTVVIETTKPVEYQTRMNRATNQFVIEVAGVELPAALQRPYNLNDKKSAIGSINAYQTAGSDTARIVIQLAQSGGEPVVQQEGTSLVIVPPAPPVRVAKPKPATPKEPDKAGREAALSARTLDEFLTGNQKFYGRLISLQAKNADVRDVINFLAEESGANIVMSDDVAGMISIKVRRIPWDQALVTVMRTRGLGYVRQGNVLRISSLKALQEETEAASKIMEAQKAIVPAIVQILPISYADLDELAKNIAPFLSKEGKVAGDKRTSTLIVTDKAEAVDRVQRLVKTLDVPPTQVSIESKIVEAAESFDTFVGVNWSFTGTDVNLSPSGGANGAPIDLGLGMSSSSMTSDFVGGSPFRANLNVGVIDVLGDLNAALTLAERDSLAKVISSPRISAMNREKAIIRQDGENVTIITTRSEQTNTVTKTEKRTPFSLELAVTPQITADGGVIMDLDVKREFLGPLLDAETGARAINKRSAKTKVLVRNGQTAVIGGIYTSDELEASTGVPGLKNIPILGWLFKSKSFSRNKNELLVFLTPRILSNEIVNHMAISEPEPVTSIVE